MMNLEIQTKPLYLCNAQHSRQGIKIHNKERLGQMMNLCIYINSNITFLVVHKSLEQNTQRLVHPVASASIQEHFSHQFQANLSPRFSSHQSSGCHRRRQITSCKCIDSVKNKITYIKLKLQIKDEILSLVKIVKDMQEYDYSIDVPLLNTFHKPIGQRGIHMEAELQERPKHQLI